MRIQTELLQDITVSRFRRMQRVVDLDPPYQREGGVWDAETQKRLIDSILNGFDVPKLYFEAATTRRHTSEGLTYQYAVIDGKQRLEAILKFMNNEMTLPRDFRFFEDDDVAAREMNLADLEKSYPMLARRFYDYQLPIVKVLADTGDLIEEMFLRLNASSALNSAERRNALAGPTKDSANSLAQHELLVRRSPIRSARYKYRELGAKFLAIEHQIVTRGKVTDTKAKTLYDLFVATRGYKPTISSSEMSEYENRARSVLDKMTTIFHDDDRLLSSIGTVVVYYLAFRQKKFSDAVDRNRLDDFEYLRREASHMDDYDPDYDNPRNVRLREYNGLVQSTNDGTALKRRSEILFSFVVGYSSSEPTRGISNISDGELPLEDLSEIN